MVGTQQFNLRWNNHTSNIIQVFLEHLSSGALVDVTLSCQGHFIGAHKIILSACSPYFQEVFAKHTDKHPIIILNGIKYEDLKSMIKFMYNGQLRVQEAQLDDLLAAAETLQVKGLSNVRSKYEKGEIMSLSSINNKSATKNKPIDSAATTMVIKNESPLHAIKAAVALLAPTAATTRAPTAATTRAPNAATVISTTPATTMTATVTHGIPTASYRTATTAAPQVSNATVPTVRTSGKRASKKVAPSVAIATLVPANTLIPVPDPRLASRRGVPRIPTVVSTVASNVVSSSVLTSSPTTTIAATTMTTTTTVFLSPTMTTTTQSALISCDNSCTLTIDPTSITSGADVHFDEIDDKANIELVADHNSKEVSDVTAVVDMNTENSIVSDCNDSAQTDKNYIMPNIDLGLPAIVTTSTLPAMTTTMTMNTPTTEPIEIDGLNKSNIAETPRVRKRRKMSHTVNELARETVFASNGTILLEPDEAVLKNMAKIKKISPVETQTAENSPTGERDEITGAKTKKPQIKIQPKQPQTSLLIKDRDKNPTKVLRPPNAFMIFANEWRRKLVTKYPMESNTKISVKLGMMWKGLNIPAKEKYYRLAKKADEEHKRKFPSYYYSPKEARMRKNSQQDSTLAKCLPTRSENPESQRMVKVYVNGEERLTNYFTDTDSSNCDDDDDDDDHYGDTEYAFGNYTEPIDHPEKSDDPEQLSQLITNSASAYSTN